MKRTRNVDPDVCKARGKLGIAIRNGDEAAAEQYREELREANVLAAIRRVLPEIGELNPQARHQACEMLRAAADAWEVQG